MKISLLAAMLAVFGPVADAADLTIALRLTPQTLLVGLAPSVAIDVTNISGHAQDYAFGGVAGLTFRWKRALLRQSGLCRSAMER